MVASTIAVSTDTWTARGRPIRDARLRARVARALGPRDRRNPAPGDVDSALARLDTLIAGTQDRDRLEQLLTLHGDLREHRAGQVADALTGIATALGRLRGITSTQTLLERAPREIAEALGFDRVFVSRVEDQMWIPVKFYVRDDEALAQALLEASAQPQPLGHLLLESKMVRRREALLVADVQGSEQVHRPIAAVSDSRSYVAAPIMPEGGVIGFLHADYYLSQRHPDETDRKLLSAFAEAFAYVVERTALLERLQAQGDQVRAMAASLEAVIDEIHESQVRMTSPAATPRPAGPPVLRASTQRVADERLGGLLTQRELEVAQLLATGATNGQIAARLVISEGTVKSHVKHVLRKLHAANRAEAASKYVRMVSMPPRGD